MNLFQKISHDVSLLEQPNPNRINYLDGWRGLAISLVLIDHFIPIYGMFLGRMGVDIFFVLSGMLMANILFVKKVDLKTFYKRRISRVFPVFLIFVSLLYLVTYLLKLSDYNEHENYLYSLSFLRSYLPVSLDIWHTGIPIGHLWSLNAEEHYYIFLSLIVFIRVFKGKEFIPLILSGIGTMVIHYIYIKNPGMSSGIYHLKTEVVASHLCLSSGYFLLKHKTERFIPSWLPVLTFFFTLLCYSKDAHKIAPLILSPFLLAFTVNHLDIVSTSLRQALSNKILQLLGIYSYSIYLWQQPFYYYGVKSTKSFPFDGLVLLLVAIFVGILSFHYIENPTRKYLNARW